MQYHISELHSASFLSSNRLMRMRNKKQSFPSESVMDNRPRASEMLLRQYDS